MPRLTKPVLNLPEFEEFQSHNVRGTLSTYAWMLLSPDLFIGTFELLNPTFKYYNGSLFFASISEANIDEWYNHFRGDMHQVELMCNHRHVCGLIQLTAVHGAATVKYVAEIFAKYWRIAITDQFPDSDVVVEIDGDDDDCTIYIYRPVHA